MTKKGIILVLAALAAAAGIWWLLRTERPGSASETKSVKPPAAAGSNAAPQAASLPAAPQPSQPRAVSGRSKQQRAELAALLEERTNVESLIQTIEKLEDGKRDSKR